MQSIKNCLVNRLYTYKRFCLPKFTFSPILLGGGSICPPSISAGKVRNGPLMAQMDGKQVILTNKKFKVWFWGFWDNLWSSENFDLQNHNGPPLWWSRSKVSGLQKSSQNPQNQTFNCFIRNNNLFFIHLNHLGAITDLSGLITKGGSA